MKIQFDTSPEHAKNAFAILICILTMGILIIWFTDQLMWCHESILRSQFPNVTLDDMNLSCNIPYDDCVFSVLSYRSSQSEHCINAVVHIASRILTSIVFILLCFLFWYTFSLSENCSHIFVKFLRIFSILILICVTIAVHWNNCYHHYITMCLYGTAGFLYPAVIYNHSNMEERKYAERREIDDLWEARIREALNDNYTISNNQVIDVNDITIDNETKSYRELL